MKKAFAAIVSSTILLAAVCFAPMALCEQNYL